ncbi:lytic transglycosylase domain-containing protein [Paraconexibacter antarcticus]|uniref:Lytic transglycosylase domain-containing protein n=1 Tax=Paraconexibacter antarcticus TaxID=2949664 RepID=A0ABY5DXI6_9ACTN|nr:lytic transglycosylase domain-containing protein [Paraconexibacter antarcticus]UTI65597.1 lytic transglycosylase domain-containing protein [Paraconexibacter antarcticus]
MTDYRALTRQIAQQHNLDPHVFERQIEAESNFNPNAGSGAGAVGIAQFLPATAASLGVNPHDPVSSLRGAAKLMRHYVKKYGSYDKALRAYNAGEGAIDRSHSFAETNNYVAKILPHGEPRPGAAAAHGTSSGTTARTSRTRTTSLPGTPDQVVPGAVTTDTTLDADALRRAQGASIVAGMLQRQGRGGPLIAALGGTAAPDPMSFLKTTMQQAAPTVVKGIPALRSTVKQTTGAQQAGHAPLLPSRGRGQVQVAAGANRAGTHLQRPILDFLSQVSAASGRPIKVTTGTNHNQYVAGEPGVQSDHWTGNATDIGLGGDARQSREVAKQGDLIAAHAIQVAAGIPFQQAYKIASAGGVHNFETKHGRVQVLWKTMVGGNHFNHVHIGLNPGR